MKKVSIATYIILTLAFFFVPSLVLSSTGIQLHTVTTGSMRPGIQPGAVVVTKSVHADKIKVGQVILYFDTQINDAISHRVVEISEKGNQVSLTTKGDANALRDPTILEPSSVPIATVIWVIPNAGFLVSALHSTDGKLGVVGTSLLVSGLLFYDRSRRNKKRPQASKSLVGLQRDKGNRNEIH